MRLELPKEGSHLRYLRPVTDVFRSIAYRKPVFEQWERIEPGVTEWFELFGLDDNTGEIGDGQYPMGPQRFEIEVRARDTQRTVKSFELDLSKRPPLRSF